MLQKAIEESDTKELDEEDLISASAMQDDSFKTSKMIIIPEYKITKLIEYRNFFGSPTFFKIFRAFYKLSNIPYETQNNPFALYMDRESCIRGFKEVFDISFEEIAVRFYKMFTLSDDELFMKTTSMHNRRK